MHLWSRLLVAAAIAGAFAPLAEAGERYTDTFYLTFRTRDFEMPDPKNPGPAIAAMEQRLLDLKRRLGLDKRNMKYFRVGFQLPLAFRDALVRTGTNSNINTSSFHRQVGQATWQAITALIDSDPRYAQWFLDNRPVGGGPVGHHGAVYATFSSYAVPTWQFWEDRVANGAATVKAPDNAAWPYMSISGPGEGGINHQVQRRKGQLPDNWADYSPFAVAEFRDWLRHRGIYGPGDRYARKGRPGGNVFADDPSPDQARGQELSFNQTYGTSFTTWTLKYWDPEKFPRMSGDDDPMPAGGKGFVDGGFDAPRKREVGAAFWDAWDNIDPKSPGFRQTLVHHYVARTMEALKRGGAPEDRCFSHQIFIPHGRTDRPEYADLGLREFLDAAPTWTARAAFGHPGFTMYSQSARDDATFRDIWEMLTPNERRFHQFALVEYHPYHLLDDGKAATKDDYARALAVIAKWRPHVVVVESWEGFVYSGRPMSPVKDTPMEEALREMIANWPDKPFWQVPDPSVQQ